MSAKTARADLTSIAMRKAHNESALLMAILRETADLDNDIPGGSEGDYIITYYLRLSRLRRLALSITTGSPDLAAVHPSRGISSFEGLRGDDDSQPARGEGPED